MHSVLRPLPALLLGSFLVAAQNNPTPRVEAKSMLANLPLAFEANRGQARTGFDFLSRGASYSLFLNRSHAAIVLKSTHIDISLAGATPGPAATGQQPLPGKINYLIGSDPSQWRTDIPTYQKVTYPRVYSGIDLVYYGNQGALEYDFIVSPRADPRQIRMTVDGATLSIDAAGDLIMQTSEGPVHLKKPVSYQTVGASRHEIASRWILDGQRGARFALGPYDHSRTVVIDPTLVHSSLLSGRSLNCYSEAFAIAVDATGATYIFGDTCSTDYPLKNPEQNFFAGFSTMFVTKLAAGGDVLVYSTYLGGSRSDNAYAIALDADLNAHLAGFTTSSDFPLKNPLQRALSGPSDAFVVKLNPPGNGLVYSTYLGGSNYDYGYGIAVDGAGNTYVDGQTCSKDFPVTPGAYQTTHTGGCDGFVTKINPSGTARSYSTYFGNNNSAYPRALGVSPQGAAYLAGETCSSSFPVTAGAAQTSYGGNCDGFVAKLNPAGAALIYATYLGGGKHDYVNAVAVDANEDAYVTGDTISKNFPVTPGVFQPNPPGAYNGFVTKLNANGSNFMFSSYLGGRRDDYASAITVDASHNAIIAGYTYSDNLPTSAALQPKPGGNTVGLFKTTNTGTTWTAADGALPGEASAISFNPSAPAKLAVLDGGGGAAYTTDGGAHWTSSNLPPYFAGLARSPANPEVLYAANSSNVFSSSDGGVNWTFAGNPPTAPYGVVADPVTPRTVYTFSYYYAPSGISVSTNGGVNWTQLTNPLGTPGAIFDLEIDPAAPRTLYAATSSGLYQSLNRGASWNQLVIGGLTNPYVTQVLINPINPGILYAVVYSQLWKSVNSGSTWTVLSVPSVNIAALAPSAPAKIYAADILGNVYFSSNSGSTWALKDSLAPANLESLAVNPADPAVAFAVAYIHATSFVAKVNPAATALVYLSYLGGSSYDYAYGLATNSSGDAFVTGYTESADFPVTPGAFRTGNGNFANSAFVSKISDATGACSWSITPSSHFFYAFGGSPVFSVVSPSGCAWTPSTSNRWIHITKSSNTGVGVLDLQIDSNHGATRTGTVTVAGQTLTLKQAAGGCVYSLSNNNLTFPDAGGTTAVNVTAGAGCDWVVTQAPSWLTITGRTGTGNGTVTIHAAASPFPDHRYGYPIIAESYVIVDQTGTTGATAPPTSPAPVLPPPPSPRCRNLPGVCPAVPPDQ